MGSEIKRKLASIQRIEEVRDIKNADAIQAYRVLGWWVVDKKDIHQVGDLVVYLSLDSWVPHELAPFLSKGQEPREYNGVKGERLRTVKLRGQVSQGLLLKLETVPEKAISNAVSFLEDGRIRHKVVNLGEDVTDLLNVQKWEPPISPQLAGQVRGVFPTSLIPKTDQERIQNCFEEIVAKGDVTYEVTLKLDGTSCTIFRWEDELRVCSRNLELKVNEENKDNTLVAVALKIADRIPNGFAFQGELMGPGIQGNREGFTEHKFFVFDIFDIQEHAYLRPHARQLECKHRGLDHVSVFDNAAQAPESVDDGLTLAEGPSINHKIREGLVWKCNEDPGFSFKTISNKFLLKGGN